MKFPAFNTLLFDMGDAGIATLTVNRPEKLNALNSEVLNELEKAVRFVEQSREIRALILTGAGKKAFVAGADIRELSRLNEEEGRALSTKGQEIFSLLENSSKPVAAVVNGYALGGGAELAMACHIRIAADTAVFGLPEVGLGIIPGYGGTQRLPQLVGKAKAMEIILTGRQVKAEEAKAIGLVNSVFPGEQVVEEAEKMLGAMLRHGPLALSYAIRSINAGYNREGFQQESTLFGELCTTRDFKEGTGAFLEKRKPKFTGE